MKSTEHYITIGETKIWTTITDSIDETKPYICLCSGGPGIGDSLQTVADIVFPRFNVIRFEQRGCGRSTQDGRYDLSTVLDDLEEIRKYYNIERWFVLGHSWGAGVALFYSIKYSSVCEGVVYISGMGIQNDMDWSKQFQKNMQNLKEPEFEAGDDFSINYDVCNKGLASYNKYIKQPTLLRDVSKSKVPVLVICGEQDIRPIWPAIQLANLLPYGELIVVKEWNHFPWHKDIDKLQKVIFDWLELKIQRKQEYETGCK